MSARQYLRLTASLSALMLLLVSACQGEIGEQTPSVAPPGMTAAPRGPAPSRPEPSTTPEPTSPPPPTLPPPAQCVDAPPGRALRGFGGEVLGGDRADLAAGLDERRVRAWDTFDSYSGDVSQKLGYYLATAGLYTPSTAASIPTRPRGWFVEGSMGALQHFTHYRLAFLACLGMLEDPTLRGVFDTPDVDYRAAPTAETAPRACAAQAQAFWSQRPSDEQVSACADFAVHENLDESPARRWAYVCAALLDSAPAVTQ
jgi:hypothetical protein